MRGPASRKPRASQRADSAGSSELHASTTVHPLLLADRTTSSRRAAVMRSTSYSGSTTRRSTVPTKPPARTDGRSARTAPPTTTRCASATKMLACGRYTSWRRRSAAARGLVSDAPLSPPSLSATSLSMSVTRAARTRYSTPAGLPQRVGRPNQETERELTDRGHDCRHPQAVARRRCLGAAERCCIRFADAYDTASLRRPPARRPERIPSPVEHPNLVRGSEGTATRGLEGHCGVCTGLASEEAKAASIDRTGVPAIGSRG